MALKLNRLNDNYMTIVDDFYCGLEYEKMSAFIQGEAFQYNINGDGNTYIIESDKQDGIVAYYTLKCNSIELKSHEEHSNKSAFPTIELSKFAIHEKYQDHKLGQYILSNYVLPHIYYIRKLTGTKVILVFSVDDERAKHVYKKVGFKEMNDEIQTLVEEYDTRDCVGMIINLEETGDEIFNNVENNQTDLNKEKIYNLMIS